MKKKCHCSCSARLSRNDAVGVNGEHSRPGCSSARPRAEHTRATPHGMVERVLRPVRAARARPAAPEAGALPVSTASFRLRCLLLVLLLLLLAASGCTTKSKAKAQAGTAFMLGQKQAFAQQQQGPVVNIVGMVRNRTIPWTEDLTLAKALVAAQYQGFSDPRLIINTRNGQQFQVNVKQLLKGREDPPLEPGDTIQIQQ